MKIGSLFNIRRRSPLGSRSSEWAQPSPRAFAILEFGKGFVIPVKAPFTQDAESAAKHTFISMVCAARGRWVAAPNKAHAQRSAPAASLRARVAVKVQNSSTFAAARCDVSPRGQ